MRFVWLQVLIEARDQALPSQSNVATLTVRVARNRLNPVFLQRDYSTTVARSFTPSLPLVTVTAVDADPPGPNSDVTYAVVGDEMGQHRSPSGRSICCL